MSSATTDVPQARFPKGFAANAPDRNRTSARGLGNCCLPCQPRWRARWARSTTVASFFRVLSAEPVRTGKRHGCASCPNGLEPLTPSLPCAAKRLPCVATGCGSACLSGFRARPICHRLPPVAPAGLHKCSIPSPGSPMAKGVRASPQGASSVEPFCVERGSSAHRPSCDGSSRRCTSSSNPSRVERGPVVKGDGSSRR